MTDQADEAAAALAAIQTSRERLAAAAHSPPERHLAFAALMGGVVAAQAAPMPISIIIVALLIFGVTGVIAWDRKRTGMFINGYRKGRTLPLTLALVAFALADIGVCVWLKESRQITWAPLAGGLIAALVAWPASILSERIYIREMRETP